ncbi:hypothetical protein RB2654_14330 [Rhodobacterales bacterium HTCC2654]|uniref:Uncharacterized protein n=1 Tax=Maritimibacter alkaliphilus HTCC2654 TaxID=314271 RepID=A3VGR5_9RHOB|nr:hypothetical protein RB2654_14330 [Rhodobacterales bacterium HTCC2654] [Maritimibacter alkaliphilus HTCC2654]
MRPRRFARTPMAHWHRSACDGQEVPRSTDQRASRL